MAKYKNFIGDSWNEFTKEEVKGLKDYFLNLVNNSNENIKNIKLKECRQYKTLTKHIVLYFESPHLEFRNVDKNRIKFDGYSILIAKESGYLRVGEEKDYKNAPKYHYSAFLIVHGKEIKYGKKNEKHMGVKNSYAFGTEFNDLDLSESLNELSRQITKL